MTSTPRHQSARGLTIGAIWAQAHNGIIGASGSMPWHVPEDLAHFKRITAGHPVIMGRNTWDSFPAKFRPLPGRSNIVLTSKSETHEELRLAGAIPASSLAQGLELAKQSTGGDEIWIIGGGKVYAEALDLLDVAIITRLDVAPDGDTKAPELTKDFVLATADPTTEFHTSSSGIGYRFESWIREKE